jgi:hypothetical protein
MSRCFITLNHEKRSFFDSNETRALSSKKSLFWPIWLSSWDRATIEERKFEQRNEIKRRLGNTPALSEPLHPWQRNLVNYLHFYDPFQIEICHIKFDLWERGLFLKLGIMLPLQVKRESAFRPCIIISYRTFFVDRCWKDLSLTTKKPKDSSKWSVSGEGKEGKRGTPSLSKKRLTLSEIFGPLFIRFLVKKLQN